MDREVGAADEESLLRIAARRAVRGLRRDATTPGFARLLMFQASGAAGDALLALALAGTLFFSVPEATARGKVALYLLLTVAPFAVVSPLLARVLDRHRGSLKWAMVLAQAGRATLTWLLATRLEDLALFPLAFGVLLLSRAALIVRGAVLPGLLTPEQSLVRANASLSRIGALSGMVMGLVGIGLVKWPGVQTELVVAAIVYYLGVLPALRIPGGRGRIATDERLGAQAKARSLSVRQAILATAGMRGLVGFLVFHLAFSLRRNDFGSVGLGLLIAAAALGGLVGAITAPKLRQALKEEGILVATLIAAGLVALAVGRWFTPVAAGILAFAFGVASGASKVAFDAVVQRETPEGGRGWAFARYESILQLAWVAGALVPLLVTIGPAAGVVAVRLVANAIALIFVFGRHRMASGGAGLLG